MRSVYSVGQVNSYIKNMFTQDFMLGRIYVKGEVSNCKYHTSGHIYFSLKDETGTIACVMFAGQRGGLAFRMREGQQVIVLGSVNVYERDGRYQLYAKEIILDGAGLLYEKFEKLKQELEEMGMFEQEYKRPIPPFASTVGIVTAPTGRQSGISFILRPGGILMCSCICALHLYRRRCCRKHCRRDTKTGCIRRRCDHCRKRRRFDRGSLGI